MKISISTRNVPIEEINNFCLNHGAIYDLPNEEIILLEVKKKYDFEDFCK